MYGSDTKTACKLNLLIPLNHTGRPRYPFLYSDEGDTHLPVFRDPVTEDVQDPVGRSSADDELFITCSLRVCET